MWTGSLCVHNLCLQVNHVNTLDRGTATLSVLYKVWSQKISMGCLLTLAHISSSPHKYSMLRSDNVEKSRIHFINQASSTLNANHGIICRTSRCDRDKDGTFFVCALRLCYAFEGPFTGHFCVCFEDPNHSSISHTNGTPSR